MHHDTVSVHLARFQKFKLSLRDPLPYTHIHRLLTNRNAKIKLQTPIIKDQRSNFQMKAVLGIFTAAIGLALVLIYFTKKALRQARRGGGLLISYCICWLSSDWLRYFIDWLYWSSIDATTVRDDCSRFNLVVSDRDSITECTQTGWQSMTECTQTGEEDGDYCR